MSSAKSSSTDGLHSQSRSSSSFARSRPAIKLSTKNGKILPGPVPLSVTAPVLPGIAASPTVSTPASTPGPASTAGTFCTAASWISH